MKDPEDTSPDADRAAEAEETVDPDQQADAELPLEAGDPDGQPI